MVYNSKSLSFLLNLRLPRIPDEIPYPSWLGSRSKLLAAVPVLKMNQIPGWAGWAVTNRPEARVLHIVRHPGGFLASWKARYLIANDREAVTAANRERLETVLKSDPRWAELWGDHTSMAVEESELWYWRYAAESIDAAGNSQANYRLVLYDELAARPAELTKEIYSFCGLSWTHKQDRLISALTRDSQDIASAWQDKLSPGDRQLVSKVLDGSVLKSWWSNLT